MYIDHLIYYPYACQSKCIEVPWDRIEMEKRNITIRFNNKKTESQKGEAQRRLIYTHVDNNWQGHWYVRLHKWAFPSKGKSRTPDIRLALYTISNI